MTRRWCPLSWTLLSSTFISGMDCCSHHEEPSLVFSHLHFSLRNRSLGTSSGEERREREEGDLSPFLPWYRVKRIKRGNQEENQERAKKRDIKESEAEKKMTCETRIEFGTKIHVYRHPLSVSIVSGKRRQRRSIRVKWCCVSLGDQADLEEVIQV